MNRKIYVISVCLLLAMAGCRGVKMGAGAEDAEVRLKLDGMLIEAKMQREAGNSEAAERGYRTILRQEPTYGAALFEMSTLLMTSGRLDSATVYAQRAVATCDSNVWYHLQLAQCLALTAQQERLTREWDRILALHPHPFIADDIGQQKKRYYAIQAEQYMNNGQYRKAKQSYDRALAADPEDAYLHISLASYYKAVGDEAGAAEALRRGFASSDIDTRTKLQLLRSFYTKEEFYGSCAQWAFPLAEMLVSEADDPAETALFHADLLMRQGKYGEAAQQFALGLEREGGNYAVWEALLVCLLEAEPKDWPSIKRYAQRAAELFPLLPMPYFALMQAAEAEGNAQEAARYKAKYEELKP